MPKKKGGLLKSAQGGDPFDLVDFFALPYYLLAFFNGGAYNKLCH